MSCGLIVFTISSLQTNSFLLFSCNFSFLVIRSLLRYDITTVFTNIFCALKLVENITRKMKDGKYKSCKITTRDTRETIGVTRVRDCRLTV